MFHCEKKQDKTETKEVLKSNKSSKNVMSNYQEYLICSRLGGH